MSTAKLRRGYNPTTQDREQLAAWLRERPEVIQRMAFAHPPWHCYTLIDSAGHYTVYSYSEDGTVTLVHGDDSTLPGVAVFGIAPESLAICDCGKWRPPTEEAIARTKKRIDNHPMVKRRRKLN